MYIVCICMFFLLMIVSHMHAVSMEARRGHQIPTKLSYK